MWEEVRKHEHEAMISPIRVVHDAFTKYSIIGSHGHVAKGHFNPYFRNHEEYVSQVLTGLTVIFIIGLIYKINELQNIYIYNNNMHFV